MICAGMDLQWFFAICTDEMTRGVVVVLCRLTVGLLAFGWWLIGGLPLVGLCTTQVLPTSQYMRQLLCSNQEPFARLLRRSFVKIFAGQLEPYCCS